MSTIKRNLVGSLTDPIVHETVFAGILDDGVNPPKKCYNVFHLWRSSIGGPAVVNSVTQALRAALGTAWQGATNQIYTCASQLGRFMDDPANAYSDIADSFSGANEDDPLDNQCAVMFKINTGFRGRNFLGSKHFGGLTETDTTANLLTGAGLTAWTALGTALTALIAGLADGEGNTWFPIVLSATLSSLEPTDVPAVFTFATWKTVTLNTRVGSMDRRKVKSVY